uniref:Pleckstrin y domain-containing family A member 7 n=1 Tax=Sipha flava TaxID=143950 RepID=A0A2S2Q3Z7_9HEMI
MATLKKNSVVVTQPMRRAMIGSSPLKSPLIKRPQSASVTLQGWLYKQGSEGLMLWKKRWFVLSEYCLFYYKNEEEEKLLGSILLPSYKISPCCPSEDKIYRKFSFKAEHDNMRTYYFAADTRELMVQWMNALSLASILQQNNGYKERNSIKQSQYINQLGNMDSGYLSSSFYSTPISYYNNDLTYKAQNNQIAQPLYANAPPKPRRVTESNEDHPQIAQPQYKPLTLVQNLNRSQLNNSERRTPDTYGRHDVKYPNHSEYEEVIDEYVPSPVKYREKKYSHRPHSADFLEYDVRHVYQTQTPNNNFSYKSPEYYNTVVKHSKRPKSSLDFIDNSDSYWSENAYAEKMRQASQSLSKETNLNRTTAVSLRQLGIYLNDIKAEPVDGSSTQMKSHHNYIKEQEKRWSEYVNSFNRSASARVTRNTDKRNYEHNEHKRSTSLQRRNSIDSRDKDKKSQQREESMKRLLDWKQRMLQSTLTRRSSGSSNRGSAQNELSKYYKKITDNRMSVKNEDKTIVNCTNNFYNSKYNNDSFSYSKNDLTIENDYNSSDDEVSGCGSAIGQGPIHREYQEINKMINETMGSKNIYSSHRNIRTRLTELDTPTKIENLQRLDELKKHLLELEKQYEKGKPLVNLVDNMVKLGSLYQAGSALENPDGLSTPTILKERLEFNDKVQEKRLLAEESKEWLRIKPDVNDLQEKVDRLYDLDQLMQEESGNLLHLRQDKELLEKALGGLRHKMQCIHSPAEEERYKRQQHVLERELSSVRSVLANNSKKLEETVAANARLESELVVLRQKLQSSRRVPDTGAGGPTVAALEAELRRVQLLVGDLQRQREDLSVQVRQLTEKSNTLSMQMSSDENEIRGKKRPANDSWIETDLDDSIQEDKKSFAPREKPQEIKTVRIVKRESERRQRDRDKCGGNIGLPLTSVSVKCVPVIEEPDYRIEENYVKKLSAQEQLFGTTSENINYDTYSDLNLVNHSMLPKDDIPLSPVYQSEAARQIVQELSMKDQNDNIKQNESLTKRLIPREKRRHHTVTSVRPFSITEPYNRDGWRARDDVDMERALRPGAPDVVRSTMNKTEPTKFSAETIDSILGTPGKIYIPERYIPESAPVSPDERKKRMHKAEAIRKMLSESTPILASEGENDEHTAVGRKKMIEEKKQRDHLLQLNQILAQQVMEKSKAVACASPTNTRD